MVNQTPSSLSPFQISGEPVHRDGDGVSSSMTDGLTWNTCNGLRLESGFLLRPQSSSPTSTAGEALQREDSGPWMLYSSSQSLQSHRSPSEKVRQVRGVIRRDKVCFLYHSLLGNREAWRHGDREVGFPLTGAPTQTLLIVPSASSIESRLLFLFPKPFGVWLLLAAWSLTADLSS